MKVKNLDGEICDILPLPTMAAFWLEAVGVGAELPMGKPDVLKRGWIYIFQEPLKSKDEFEELYRRLQEDMKGNVPSRDELLANDGLVLGRAQYHYVRQSDGTAVLHVDAYEPMTARVSVDENGEMFEVADDDVAEESVEDRRKHWEDFLLPIPPPPKKCSDEVFLTLAYEFYDAIKGGEKTTEYRAYTPNWVKKLVSHPIRTVKFQRGYGGPGHAEPEQMVFEIKKIWLYESESKMKGDPQNPPAGILPDSLAIDLGKRIR